MGAVSTFALGFAPMLYATHSSGDILAYAGGIIIFLFSILYQAKMRTFDAGNWGGANAFADIALGTILMTVCFCIPNGVPYEAYVGLGCFAFLMLLYKLMGSYVNFSQHTPQSKARLFAVVTTLVVGSATFAIGIPQLGALSG